MGGLNMEQLTVNQAISEGYTKFAYDNGDQYQSLIDISHIQEWHFKEPHKLVLADKEPVHASISVQEIKDAVIDMIMDQDISRNDDTDVLPDSINSDNSPEWQRLEMLVNKICSAHDYHWLTKIQLIP